MNKIFFSFFLLFSGFSLVAQPQDLASKNLTLLGHLPYEDDLNDVWAYVDSLGNEYALVGTTVGLSIVDVNDPSNPTELHFIPGPSSVWRDMHIFNDHAYVSNETSGGTLIVNLASLPQTVAYKDTALGGSTTAHNVWIEDGYLYVIGFNGSGLLIFDLNNDPWNPEFTGFYLDRYVHDLYVRGDTGYSAEVYDGLLTILDLSDKSSPKVISTHDYPGSFTHATWLNDAGNVCFTMDELSQAYTYAWDVSDPTDIKELDRIRSSLSYGKAAPHNVHVLNDFLINSVYADGVQLVDAARPWNLVEVGFFDTTPRVGGGLKGCWGAYPFLPSGIVLANDMENGLFILQPNYVRACYLEGNVKDAVTNAPLSNVEIEIIGTEVLDYSKTTGEYAVGIADADTYTVIYSKLGYNRETRTISLSNGNLHLENVALTPSSLVELTVTVLDFHTNQPISDAQIEVSGPDDFQTQIATDQSGVGTETNFVTGGYKAIVGKWGYQSVLEYADITETNSGLTVYLKKGFYDDFTFDFGWFGTLGAQTGNWVRDKPIGTYNQGFMFNPDHDSQRDIGERAYVTGNSQSGSTTNDVSNGATILFSPQMDLRTYTDPVISFDWWMANRSPGSGTPGNDTLRATFLVGSEVYEIAKKSNYWAAWEHVEFRVLDYTTIQGVNVLKFEVGDMMPNHIVEAGIDNFQIIETGWAVNVEKEIDEIDFQIYPNPVKDQFFVEFDLSESKLSGKTIFEVIDLQGRQVFKQEFTGFKGKQMIDIALPVGMYIGNLKVDGQVVESIKWVKE